MAKTKRVLRQKLSLVDIVIEALDARAPYSCKNREIDELAKNKKRVIALNKTDLADEDATAEWSKRFAENGFVIALTDAASGGGVSEISRAVETVMRDKTERLKKKGVSGVTVRAMIVGAPNVGKSSIINKLSKRAATVTADRPGVTRGEQWITVRKGFELLDTPGILAPKFESERVGLNLAFIGAIKDSVLDVYSLSLKLIERLLEIKPDRFFARYGVSGGNPEEILSQIALTRGFKMKGGVLDIERAAITALDEFRGGKLGRVTLETWGEYNA
jgi:ribosome biogenesis GTPase A